MIIGEIISAILSNFVVTLLAIAIVMSIVKIRRAKLSRRPYSAVYIVWGELLFYMYGIGAIYGGFFHAYFGTMAAAGIGWQNSPFQYELGWFEIGIGLAALFARRQNYGYRLALTIPIVVFSFAAAAQHIALMLTKHNFAPNNAGMMLWLNDIIMPLILAWVAFAARDAGR